MEEEKVIDIKVQVDKSNVEKSYKDIEKQSVQTSKKVSKQTKDIATQMSNAFKNVNISGLTKQMNKVKQTVSKTMKQVKAEIKGTSFSPDISNIRNMQNALGTSKLKEDAIALGNALAQVQRKANQAGVSLSSLNDLQQLNNILASSNTKLTNTQRGAMMRYASNAIAELGQVNAQQSKLAVGIGKVVSVYRTTTPKVVSLINQIKTKTIEWWKNHKKASDGIQSANKKLSSRFKSLLSAMMPFLSIYAIFSGLKNAITNAMESIETDNMFNTVFGSSASDMNKWVSEVNKTLGLGITNTKQYTATISQMGRAMGLTGTQAMEMSQTMALMAGDISSFYNTDLATVQNDLRSALSGSFETMDKYGVILRANTIKEYAYANGIANTGAELTNAQRAMATTMMIEQQLGLANGDLARSLNSPSNQARILRSNLSDLSVALGKCFMPILTVVLPILNTFVKALTSTINAIANFISQVFALFGVDVDFGIGGVVDDITGGLEDANDSSSGVSDDLANGAESAKKIAKSLSGIDELNILSDNSSSSSSSGGSGSTGGGISGGTIDTGAMEGALVQTETKFSQWAQKVSSALQSVWGALKDGWNSVGDYINTSLDNLKQAFSNLGTSIESFLVGCWNNGGEELIYNIGRLAGAFAGLALDIGGQVIDAVAKLFAHLNPDNNVNTRKFIEAMNKALEACQNFALSAGGWLKTFMDNGGQEFLNNMGDICVIIGTTLVDAVADGIQAITDFLNSAEGQQAIKDLAGAVEDLSEKLEDISTWVLDNSWWLILLGGFILGIVGGMKMAAGVIQGISLAFQSWGWISRLIAMISGALTNLWNVVLIPIYNAIMVGLGAIASFFGVSVGWVVVAIGILIGAIYLLWDNWDWLCEKAGELKEWIAQKWTEIKEWVVKKVAEMVDGVKQWWNDLKTNTVNKFNEIKTSITNKWSEIKTSVINKVIDIKDGIKEKFEQAYTTVTDVFTKIKTKIKEKIEEARDSVKKAIDKIKGFFNFEWSLPKLKLPKISISGSFSLNPISVPSFGISWHRQGGILPAGSNAIFGMNGNNLMAGGEISTGGEAILPLSDLFKEMRDMFDTQNRQLISSLSKSNNNQPVTLVLEMNGKEVARGTVESMNQLANLNQLDLSWL